MQAAVAYCHGGPCCLSPPATDSTICWGRPTCRSLSWPCRVGRRRSCVQGATARAAGAAIGPRTRARTWRRQTVAYLAYAAKARWARGSTQRKVALK
eukprot:6061993-Lingulodinium_polyedra.AAC.1